ncbi:MAG: PilC/PilY family type IV pilus protein [Pseudoxanthomonas sp.]
MLQGKSLSLRHGGYAIAALALLALLAVLVGPVVADTSTAGLDIPDSPLITDSTIAPNVLFVLDDSGSMESDYMPDDVPTVVTGSTASTNTIDCATTGGNNSTATNYTNSTAIGYLACSAYPRNTLYYNPATTYYPWTLPTSDSTTTNRMTGGTTYGAAYADTMFVPYSGTGPAGSGAVTTTSTTTNLASSVRTFYVPKDTSQTANSYLSLATNYYRYQILTDGTVWRSEYTTYTSSNTSSTSGTIQSSVSASSGKFSTAYTFTVPDGVTSVTFSSSGASSSYYLYVKAGSAVSSTNNSSAACSVTTTTSASKSCTVSTTTSGTVYYVNIYVPSSNNNQGTGNTNNSTTVSGVTLAYSYSAGGCDTTTGSTTYGWRNCTETTPTGRTEAAELVNYATWYSYYRTRIKAAKAGASAAFAELDDSVRVGFRTINSKGVCGGSASYSNSSTGTCKTSYSSTYNLPTQDVPIPVTYNNGVFSDSSTTSNSYAYNNRTQWYNRLFATVAANSTPLRTALANAGVYFSSSDSTGAYGPESSSEQYACRQNFSILTTDGFWNDSYSNSTIGNSDNADGTTWTSSSGTKLGYTAADPYKGGLASDSTSTLADVANYYWKNDLRTDLANNVPTSSTLSSNSTPDLAFWQHMVTFTIGLGLSGTVNEDSVYEVLNQGYATYTSGTSTVTGWPTPTSNSTTTIDDLLHAAVNGHGTYVAANDPDSFATGLTNALASVTARIGSFSSVTTKNTSVSSGNYLFASNYVSNVWTGQLYACAATDSSCSSPLWTTATTLEDQYGYPATATTIANRGIYTWNGSAGATFPTTAQQTTLGGSDVTDYLRGVQDNELLQDGTLRNRTTLLGDIVDSSPTYVSATNTVYAGANDGMLHAFNAATGAELFAYIPASVVGDDLASLASTSYSHKYFVDGPITVSTTSQTSSKNILVGALGRGGKGLYALDVTSPTSFDEDDVLWEVTETTGTAGNMGKILGQPFIAKLNNGVTALVTGNGINSSNGCPVLLIYNVTTGALIKQISADDDYCGTGTTYTTTNGLNAPTGWDDDSSGTVDYVYAADLQGHIWKFDLSATSTSSWALSNGSKPVFTATYGSTTAQPVTSGVMLAENSSTGDTWVFFGTGKYLQTSDITDTSVQTMYGFIDSTSSTTSITLTPSDLTARKMYETTSSSTGETVRSFEDNDALDTDTEGWYINLVVDGGTAEGERVITTPQSYGSYLIFSTVIPSVSTGCSSSGTSWIYALDMFTGTSSAESYFDLDSDGDTSDDTTTAGTAVGGVSVSSGMASLAALLNGKLVTSDSSGTLTSVTTASITGSRVSWREIRKED